MRFAKGCERRLMNIVLAGPLCKLMWSLDFFLLVRENAFRASITPADSGTSPPATRCGPRFGRQTYQGRTIELPFRLYRKGKVPESWVSGGVSKSENPLEALPRGNADLEVSRDCVFTIRYI
jgi:hypothetical protein